MLCTSKKTALECEGQAMGQAQRSRKNILEGERLPQLSLQRRAIPSVQSHFPPPTPQPRRWAGAGQRGASCVGSGMHPPGKVPGH